MPHDTSEPHADNEVGTVENNPPVPTLSLSRYPTMTDTLFRLSPAALLAVAPCVPTEETRYYPNGICIEPSGWCVATDGHIFGAVHVGGQATLPTAPLILSLPKPALAMLRAACKARVPLVIHGTRGAAPGQIMLTPETVDGAPWSVIPPAFGGEIDGTFPDWRRVIPRDLGALNTAPTARFAPAQIERLLGVLAYAVDCYPGERNAPETADIRGPGDGACVLLTGSERPAIAVIMPARTAHAVETYATALRAAGITPLDPTPAPEGAE